MNFFSLSCILIGVSLNACAQLFLKAGTNHIGEISFSLSQAPNIILKMATQPFILSGVSCYVFSLVVWIMALSRVEVSVAYPMLSLGYVVNAILAHYLFGETLSMPKIIGIVIILIGVTILAKN